MTDFTPPFPPAPAPVMDVPWVAMTIAARKRWYAARHKAFFAAWKKFLEGLKKA